jgi:multisubunit Na+/H+ antiporter MnhB subunit
MGTVCFFVYDSLGSAIVTMMVAIGLLARPRQEPEGGVPA